MSCDLTRPMPPDVKNPCSQDINEKRRKRNKGTEIQFVRKARNGRGVGKAREHARACLYKGKNKELIDLQNQPSAGHGTRPNTRAPLQRSLNSLKKENRKTEKK